MQHRLRRLPLFALLAVAVTLGGAVPAAAAPPPAPDFGPGIESLSPYEGQTTCDPSEKPGVLAFRSLLQRSYPGTGGGISRGCDVGGTSEHKEGRAFDWGLNAFRVADRVKADEVLTWLLSTDCHGNEYAMARRLGIQYIIWDRQVWSSYRASRGWAPYSGPVPHTDHVHFSFSWAGARQQTTYWTRASQGSGCIRPGTAPTSYGPFVKALYDDFLGRAVDPGGLQTWTGALSTHQLSPQQVAYALATTDEYINHVVSGFYRTTLRREPDPAGLADWRAAIRAGMPVQDVAASFYASQEYFNRMGGDPTRWVQSLYRDLLEREPDPVGVRHWVAQSGSAGRVSVVLGFYQSPETLQRRVRVLYRDLLGRDADPAGLATWPALVRDQGDFVLASFLASSAEYYQRAQGRY